MIVVAMIGCVGFLPACVAHDEGDSCGPASEVMGASLEGGTTSGGAAAHVGDVQTVVVQYFVQKTAGCAMVGDLDSGERCECTEPGDALQQDFAIVSAACDDGACEVMGSGPVMSGAIGIDIVLKQPSATLRVHAAAATSGDQAKLPEADGVFALTALP